MNQKIKNSKPLYVVKASEAKLHITKGNSKVGKGIYTFSTLPGNEDNLLTINGTTLLTNIPGTCSKHCAGCFNGGCYAVNSAKLHHNAVVKAWAENTLLLRMGKLFAEIDAFITAKNKKYEKTHNTEDAVVKTFRINVSGEIQSCSELESWDDLAAKHPEVTFGVYTKNYEALSEFIDKRGDSQSNFVINVSQWHGVADDFLRKYTGVNVFEYDDSNRKNNELSEADKARLKNIQHCPAVTAEGKHAKTASGADITCDRCGRCYRKTGSITAVYAH